MSLLIVVDGEGNLYIAVPPVNTTALQGSRVKLNCQAEGYPNNITYLWFHNDNNVHNSPGLMARAGIYVDGSLVITSVVKDDLGWYRCRPHNGVAMPPPEAGAFLNVTYLPYVVNMPVQMYLPRGMMGRIECPVEANPPVTLILWSKNDRLIDVTQMTRMKLNKDGALVIKSVIAADEGKYSCTPYSPLGFGPASASVHALVRDPPYFSLRPAAIYQGRLGESVTLLCEAEGDPTPTIYWKKVEGALSSSTRVLKDVGNIIISNLKKDDHGFYECIATNVVASIVATTQLIIEHTTPHAPYNVSVETDSFSAVVTWLPAYDGGHPQHYVLWFKVLGSSVRDAWQTLQILPDDATSVTVYRLAPSTLYQFMVLSRNRLGDGLFSKPVTVATKGPILNMGGIVVLSPSPRQFVVPSPTTDVELETTHFQKEQEFIKEQKPLPPVNLSLHQLRGGSLNISWQAPLGSPSQITSYQIQYRTVGQWVPLGDRLSGNATSFLWTTASRGAIYSFRITSYNSQLAESDASDVLVFSTGDTVPNSSGFHAPLVGSVVGLLTLGFAMVCLFFSLKHCLRKKRREKSTRYGNIHYFGPKHAEDTKQNGKRLPKGSTCDTVESELSLSSSNHVTSNYQGLDRKMKETPI